MTSLAKSTTSVIESMQRSARAQLVEVNTPRPFSLLLRLYRERGGMGRGSLAKAAGIDPSYLTRLENADRGGMRRDLVDSLARALHLGPIERDRLLVSAAYAPDCVTALGYWDESLELVASVLTNPHYNDAEREHFRTVIRLICERW